MSVTQKPGASYGHVSLSKASFTLRTLTHGDACVTAVVRIS